MAPSIPQWFEEALEAQFDGDLRIRWSDQRKEWHIEQRVGRAMLAPGPVGQDDRLIRARDGYSFFGAVQAIPRRPCETCGFPIEAPHLRWAEVRCAYCASQGESGRQILAYFPLGHALLQHLRKHDPTKDRIKTNIREIDLHNRRRDIAQERAASGESQDYLTDWVTTEHFPVAGLPGKTADAPWNN